jgi:hemolysin III
MFSMSHHRAQSIAEEVANSITHGLGLVASVAATPVLVIAAAERGDAWLVVGAAVFGATLVLCYLSSTLYHAVHAVRRPVAKQRLRMLDHSAIFLLIAGTYTPFALGALRGPFGWTLLAIVWALALLGIGAKLRLGFRFPRLSMAVYLGMGWMAALILRPLATAIGLAGLAWLAAGGIAYTAGIVFYARDSRTRFAHAVWHVFVAAGSACHYVAVLRHAF